MNAEKKINKKIHQKPVQNSLKESRIQSVWGSVTLSTEKVEFENEATTTQCNVYQHQIGSHDRFVAAPTLQSGLATAATHTLETLLLPSADLQDEAKDDAKKKKDLNDFPDLTERSGRAVKVSSRVKFI